MNKEKMLKLLSLAIDKKAQIDIRFPQFHKEMNWQEVTKAEALDLAIQFSQALGVEDIRKQLLGIDTESFLIEGEFFYIGVPYVRGESDKEEAKQKRIEALEKELAELKNDREVTA